jgi:hypothetical protein
MAISPYSSAYEGDPSQKQFATNPVTAMRYPEVERVAKERQTFEQGRDYLVGQGLGLTEAEGIIKNQIAMEKQANVAAVRNKLLQQSYAMSDAQRNLDAHNAALEAGMQLHNIDLTKEGATDQLAKIQSSLSKHYGTEAATPIFQELASSLKTAKDFEGKRIAEKAEERRAEREALAVKQATPEYKAQVAGAETKARIKEVAADRQLKQWELEQTPMYQAKLRAEQAKTGLQNRQAVAMLQSQKKDLLSRYGISEPDFTSAVEVNEKGSAAKKGEGTHLLFKTIVNKKTKPRIISKDEVNQIQDRLGTINDQIDALKIEAGSTALPSASSEDTTSTQQPFEGMRVVQDGQTYEYRNGNYTPVE